MNSDVVGIDEANVSAWMSEHVNAVAPLTFELIAGGRARLGQTLYVPMPGRDVEVEVTSPIFYDPKGERLNG